MYEVISRAVESGIDFGFNRAYKYTEEPSQDLISERIYDEIMSALCEVLVFSDGEDGE